MTDTLRVLVDMMSSMSTIAPLLGGGIITFTSISLKMTLQNIKRQKNIKNNYLKLCRQGPDVKKGQIMNAYWSKKDNPNCLDIIRNTKYPKELEQIVETFQNYGSPEDLRECANNLKSVKINYKNILKDAKEYLATVTSGNMMLGQYHLDDNEIDIFFDKEGVLSHEFLHMASTTPFSTGFQTTINGIELGRGLNEGMTELLNIRIFNPHNKKYSYRKNVKLVRLLETLFDNPKELEHAYFKGNIDGAFLPFIKYGTKDEFFEFLNRLDNFALTNIPLKSDIEYIKTQLDLYDIIKRTKDKDKIEKAESVLDESKLIKLLRTQKIKLKPTKITNPQTSHIK